MSTLKSVLRAIKSAPFDRMKHGLATTRSERKSLEQQADEILEKDPRKIVTRFDPKRLDPQQDVDLDAYAAEQRSLLKTLLYNKRQKQRDWLDNKIFEEETAPKLSNLSDAAIKTYIFPLYQRMSNKSLPRSREIQDILDSTSQLSEYRQKNPPKYIPNDDMDLKNRIENELAIEKYYLNPQKLRNKRIDNLIGVYYDSPLLKNTIKQRKKELANYYKGLYEKNPDPNYRDLLRQEYNNLNKQLYTINPNRIRQDYYSGKNIKLDFD